MAPALALDPPENADLNDPCLPFIPEDDDKGRESLKEPPTVVGFKSSTIKSWVGIGVLYTCSLLVVGLIVESLLLVDAFEDNEHKEAVDPCDLNEAVEDVITTDMRLDGRPKINTVSNK